MPEKRSTPIEISKDDFRKIGYMLVDKISNFIDTISENPVTPGESPAELNELLEDESLPDHGKSAEELLSSTADLLFEHSLLNGHPKFLGYITSSAAPIGAFADLLASSVNPNVGAQILSPVATEIEKQTIKWLAEFIGVSPTYGGILVSGGSMANFTAFVAARTKIGPEKIVEDGIENQSMKLLVYCSKTTHVWIEKAAFLFGLGSKSIRWIETDANNSMRLDVLEKTIKEDLENDYKPMMVVGTAGDVSTGIVDNLKGIAAICKSLDIWFHIDGAYGLPAIIVPKFKHLFQGLEEADSIALDPHKWLYSPLEAGCVLVKDKKHLNASFNSYPEYYNYSKNQNGSFHNYYEYGIQNSRGFRALKVWLGLQHVGKNGYLEMIKQDIELSELMYNLAIEHPELEAVSQNLSITTFRYIPLKLNSNTSYLNTLNEALVDDLQKGGKVFLSNAIVKNKYCLRGCIVNFRTSKNDINELIEFVVERGRKLHGRFQEN